VRETASAHDSQAEALARFSAWGKVGGSFQNLQQSLVQQQIRPERVGFEPTEPLRHYFRQPRRLAEAHFEVEGDRIVLAIGTLSLWLGFRAMWRDRLNVTGAFLQLTAKDLGPSSTCESATRRILGQGSKRRFNRVPFNGRRH
jgi:hypothetical protein